MESGLVALFSARGGYNFPLCSHFRSQGGVYLNDSHTVIFVLRPAVSNSLLTVCQFLQKKKKTVLNFTLDVSVRDAGKKRRCREQGLCDGEERTAPLVNRLGDNVHTLIVKTCY